MLKMVELDCTNAYWFNRKIQFQFFFHLNLFNNLIIKVLNISTNDTKKNIASNCGIEPTK